MSSITEIEQAVQQLAPEELARFREWFAQYDAERWDREIEDDARAGRLENLADEAIRDAQAGRCTDL